MASLILINILFVKMLNIFKKYFFDFFEKIYNFFDFLRWHLQNKIIIQHINVELVIVLWYTWIKLDKAKMVQGKVDGEHMKIMKRDSLYLCNLIGDQRTKRSFHRGFPCSHHSKPLLNNMSNIYLFTKNRWWWMNVSHNHGWKWIIMN